MAEQYYQIYKPKFSGEQWKNNQVLPILYPVYVYKLTCAVSNEREMNVFQDSIFRLVVAGCLNPNEIADLLNLDKQLVVWILHTQLINSRGLLDEQLKITEVGKTYLQKNDNNDIELRTIWAFQDGLTGEWLPRFCYPADELEVADFDDKGLPSFLIDREKGRKDKPYRIQFSYIQNEIPDFSEILDKPTKEYISDFLFAKQNDKETLKKAKIRRIVSTPSKAEKIWLYAYVFAQEFGRQGWLVSDPFGFKDAVQWLRKPLQKNIDRHPRLAKQMAQMLGYKEQDKLSPAEFIAHQENQTRLELVAEYAWLDKVPNASDYLFNILSLSKRLEIKDSQHDIDNLLIQCQNLIECILKYWIAQYPVNQKTFPNKKVWATIDRTKLEMFFNHIPINLPADVKDILLRQKASEVFSALIYNNKSMKATLFAVLLSTVEHTNHPILQYTANDLQLKKLLELADKRNSVGHATTQKITKIDKEESLFWVDFTVNWVKLFGQSI